MAQNTTGKSYLVGPPVPHEVFFDINQTDANLIRNLIGVLGEVSYKDLHEITGIPVEIIKSRTTELAKKGYCVREGTSVRLTYNSIEMNPKINMKKFLAIAGKKRVYGNSIPTQLKSRDSARDEALIAKANWRLTQREFQVLSQYPIFDNLRYWVMVLPKQLAAQGWAGTDQENVEYFLGGIAGHLQDRFDSQGRWPKIDNIGAWANSIAKQVNHPGSIYDGLPALQRKLLTPVSQRLSGPVTAPVVATYSEPTLQDILDRAL